MNLNLDNFSTEYKLKLAYLNEVEVGELAYCYETSYTGGLIEIDELTFSLPSVVSDSQGNMFETPGYKELEADMLILLEDDIYFYIDSCVESSEEGRSIKTVHAYSREYELSFKTFNNYSPETERFIYFNTPVEKPFKPGFPWTNLSDMPRTLRDAIKENAKGDRDPDGYFYGIFNEIERLTQWRLERYSTGNPIIPSLTSETSGQREWLAAQTRMIETSDSNLLEVMKEIQEAWGVFFEYDTKRRIISIKTIEDLLMDRDGVTRPEIGLLSDKNFIEKLTKERKTQDIKTRLYLYNRHGDGVTAPLTGYGQPYVEDYSYYRTPKYMSYHLLEALKVYDEDIKAATPEIEKLFDKLMDIFEEEKLVEKEIFYLKEYLSRQLLNLSPLTTILEGFKNGDEVILPPGELTEEQQKEYDYLTKNIADIKKEIDSRLRPVGPRPVKTDYFEVTVSSEEEGEEGVLKTFKLYGGYANLETLAKEADDIRDDIRAHQELHSMEEIFSAYAKKEDLKENLMYEMEAYIKEATHKSDYIEDAKELQDLGLKLIKNISSPKTQVSLDAFDFLSLVEFSASWHLVSLGDILKLENEQLDFSQRVLLLKYSHTPSSNSLTLEFSEDLVLASDVNYIAELIAKSASVSSQVSFNSSMWGGRAPGGQGGGLGGYGQSDLDLATQIQTGVLIADEIYSAKAEIGHIITDRIDAVVANIDSLVAGSIDANNILTDVLTANLAKIDFAEIGVANVEKLIAKTAFIELLTAKEAFIERLTAQEAFIERLTAQEAFIDRLTAQEAFIKNLTAEFADIKLANIDVALIDKATIDDLTARIIEAESINTKFLTAELANIDVALIDKAIIDSLTARIIEAESINTKFLTAELANIRYLSSDIINAETIEAKELKADLINAILLYAETATFQTLFAEKMLTEDGFFRDLTAIGFSAVQIDAGTITAGTLRAERILLEGGFDADGNPTGLLLALNNLGELVSENVDSLDGHIITNNSVNAEKIIANSITAREIDAGAITATEIAANAIKSSHIATAGLDAGVIKTGTLDASRVAISNLSASLIKLDRLESLNGAFFMDMESGDFNLGGAVVKTGNNVSIRVGNQSIEDYVEGKVSHRIEVLPSQIFINTDNAGKIEEKQSFALSVGVYEGQDLKGFAITGIHLKDSNGKSIVTTGFLGSAGPAPDGQEAELLASFDKGTELEDDQGTLNFLITLTDGQKQYFHKIGWSKIKAPAKQVRVEVISSNGEVFKNNLISTVLKAVVYEDNIDITDTLSASRFHWEKINSDGTPNTQWNKMFEDGAKEVPVTASDVAERATFSCTII